MLQGGIKAVVWTDVFQLVMILLGMVAILYKVNDNVVEVLKNCIRGTQGLMNFEGLCICWRDCSGV